MALEKKNNNNNKSTWDAASFWTKWTFSVANPLLVKGKQQPLNFEDMFSIRNADSSFLLSQELQKTYFQSRKIGFLPRLLVALFRLHPFQWFLATFYSIVEGLIRIALPISLIFLLRALKDEEDESGTNGYIWAGVISGLVLLQTFIHHILFFFTMRLGWNWRAATTAFIYNGLFHLNDVALQGTTTGRMVNLISNDVSRLEEFAPFACFTWISLLEVLLILLVLIYILGYASALAGVGCSILFIPPMIQLAKRNAFYRGKTAAATDQRVRHISEIIDGIASVKSYAWENPFFALIGTLRVTETASIAQSQNVRSANQALMFCTPAIVSFITFVVYWSLGGELTIPIVFSTISLLQVLRASIGRQWTRSMELMSEALASCERIEKFLELAYREQHRDEVHVTPTTTAGPVSSQHNDPTRPSTVSSMPNGLQMQTLPMSVLASEDTSSIASVPPSPLLLTLHPASYYYGDDASKLIIKDISFSLSRGELLMVVGAVGAGKSTLLSAVLGEMKYVAANVDTAVRELSPQVRFAYCAQRPWVIAATVQANIAISGQLTSMDYKSPTGMNDSLYQMAIDSTMLRDDLKRWPGADQTEIGERGVSISGGQKARVSLARAVYSDADVFVLDDPLSAVDAHVGQAMMTQCIQHTLQRRGKGVILVTHQLQYLHCADKVLVLDKAGQQIFYGSYRELLQRSDVKEILELKEEVLVEQVGVANEQEGSLDVGNETVESTQVILHEKDPHSTTSAKTDSDNSTTSNTNSNSNKNDNQVALDTDINTDKQTPTSDKSPQPTPSKQHKIIAAEIKQTGRMSWDIYQRYLKAGGYLQATIVFFILLLSQVILMFTDYWLRWWASNTYGSQQHTFYIYYFLMFVLLCIFIGYLRVRIWFQFTLSASSNLHQQSLWSILHSPMSFFLANPTGRILNRFAKDQNLIDETLPLTLYMFLESFIYCLAAIVLVCISIPWLILMMPILLGMFLYLRETYLKSTREIKRIEAITRSPLYSDFSATLDGLITLKAYRLKERISYLFQYQLDQNGQVFFSFLMVARWLGFRLDIETSLILMCVSFVSVILRNSVDVGLIGFTLVYTMALSGLFQWAVRLSVEAETQMTAVERILEYAQLPCEAGYASTLEGFLSSTHHSSSAPTSSVNVKDSSASSDRDNIGETVEFQQVTVTYREDLKPVLNQLSLLIQAGQKVGICGRTGCGKSSTLLALLRLNLITEGDILINGRSLLAMSLEESRSLITIIPQEPHLFSGTVRFNVDPFQLYSDVEIWSALRDAHIADALKSSEEGAGHRSGLETVVEEGGKNFSVGQRQLLSLARAILRKSPVVLMDEVTASIDFQTDRLIQETIRTSPALRQATIITIAHRLRTISDSDCIVVIDAGKVVESDRPRELLAKEDSLFRLLAEQSGEYDEICRIAGAV